MLKINLQNGTAISLPQHTSEIKYITALELQRAMERYNYARATVAPDDDEAMKAADDLFDAAISDAMRAIYGDAVDSLPMFSENQGFEAGKELTLHVLYEYIFQLAATHQPTEPTKAGIKANTKYSLEWNGQRYTIAGKTVESLTQYTANAILAFPMTVGETVEVLECRRMAERARENAPQAGEGETLQIFHYADENVASQLATLSIREMAILWRKEGEQLPSSPTEREAFIVARMKDFQSIPLSAVLDASFFLASRLQGYVKTQATRHFSKVSASQPKSPSTVLKVSKSPRRNGIV